MNTVASTYFTNPAAIAMRTRPATLCVSSFFIKLVRCVSTVRGLMKSFPPISFLLNPSANAARPSISRSLESYSMVLPGVGCVACFIIDSSKPLLKCWRPACTFWIASTTSSLPALFTK